MPAIRVPPRTHTSPQAMATVPLNPRSLGDRCGMQAPLARAARRGAAARRVLRASSDAQRFLTDRSPPRLHRKFLFPIPRSGSLSKAFFPFPRGPAPVRTSQSAPLRAARRRGTAASPPGHRPASRLPATGFRPDGSGRGLQGGAGRHSPDDDIHDQEVAEEPHDADHGVEGHDRDGGDYGGAAARGRAGPAARAAIAAAAGLGAVPAQRRRGVAPGRAGRPGRAAGGGVGGERDLQGAGEERRGRVSQQVGNSHGAQRRQRGRPLSAPEGRRDTAAVSGRRRRPPAPTARPAAGCGHMCAAGGAGREEGPCPRERREPPPLARCPPPPLLPGRRDAVAAAPSGERGAPAAASGRRAGGVPLPCGWHLAKRLKCSRPRRHRRRWQTPERENRGRLTWPVQRGDQCASDYRSGSGILAKRCPP